MVTPKEINRQNREYYGQVEPPVPAYERRFVAYIDIVGWKDACYDSRQHATVFAVAKTLCELPGNFSRDLKDKLNQTRAVAPDHSHQKTEVVTFSDNLAISTAVDVGHTLFFKFLTSVCCQLLTKGFLARGGVTVGDVCHKENMIFGPALIEAVSLEKEASFPRLMCSRNLIEEVERSPDHDLSDLQVIIPDHLGQPVVNLLAFAQQSNPAAWQDIETKIAEKIILLDSHLEKWRYMSNLLQRMIQGTSKR